MADLFREVDEAMRQDRMAKFWKENATYIVAFVLGTIILTAGFSGYKAWDIKTKQTQTAALIALQDAPDYPDNVTDSAIAGLRPGLRSVILMDAAATKLEKKKPAEALKFYETAAADAKIPQDIRHLATLMSVRILSNDKAADGKGLTARLAPLWENPENTWAAHAHLEAAIITANVLTDPDGARTHLNAIQDMTGLPETLYEKARALDHIYALRTRKEPQTSTTRTDSKS